MLVTQYDLNKLKQEVLSLPSVVDYVSTHNLTSNELFGTFLEAGGHEII